MKPSYEELLWLDERRYALFRQGRFGSFANTDRAFRHALSEIAWSGFVRELEDAERLGEDS
jgi:hypothetical protein